MTRERRTSDRQVIGVKKKVAELLIQKDATGRIVKLISVDDDTVLYEDEIR